MSKNAKTFFLFGAMFVMGMLNYNANQFVASNETLKGLFSRVDIGQVKLFRAVIGSEDASPITPKWRRGLLTLSITVILVLLLNLNSWLSGFAVGNAQMRSCITPLSRE